MATSKLIKPTNVTVSIPEFTDAPDQRVNSNCIDKIIDGINSVSDSLGGVTHDATFTTIEKNGRVCCGSIVVSASELTGSVGTLGAAYKPSNWVRADCRKDDASAWGKVDISPSTGEITFRVPSTGTYYCMVVYMSAS